MEKEYYSIADVEFAITEPIEFKQENEEIREKVEQKLQLISHYSSACFFVVKKTESLVVLERNGCYRIYEGKFDDLKEEDIILKNMEERLEYKKIVVQDLLNFNFQTQERYPFSFGEFPDMIDTKALEFLENKKNIKLQEKRVQTEERLKKDEEIRNNITSEWVSKGKFKNQDEGIMVEDNVFITTDKDDPDKDMMILIDKNFNSIFQFYEISNIKQWRFESELLKKILESDCKAILINRKNMKNDNLVISRENNNSTFNGIKVNKSTVGVALRYFLRRKFDADMLQRINKCGITRLKLLEMTEIEVNSLKIFIEFGTLENGNITVKIDKYEAEVDWDFIEQTFRPRSQYMRTHLAYSTFSELTTKMGMDKLQTLELLKKFKFVSAL